MGRLRARQSSSGDEVLIALRVYLDGSGKKHEQRITLAGFAGPDGIWAMVDYAWHDILHSHPLRPDYVHMKELAHLKGEYSRERGWDIKTAFTVVNNMLSMLQMMDKDRFKMFYCTIDLDAHRKLRREGYIIPSPIQLCNSFCSEQILKWYIEIHRPKLANGHVMIDEAFFYFDKDEDFFHPFFRKWEAETRLARKQGRISPWSIISQVTPVDMRRVPGIQAADVLAWCINREKTSHDGVLGHKHGWLMKQVISSRSADLDETAMRKLFPRVQVGEG